MKKTVSIPLRYGTTSTEWKICLKNQKMKCQFLLGTVQHVPCCTGYGRT